MTKRIRRNHNPAFKAKVALAAVKGEKMSINIERGPPIGVRPWRWTVSSGCFDRLLGVLILELHGAEIAEGRVQPS
jgi:hypothetical protein